MTALEANLIYQDHRRMEVLRGLPEKQRKRLQAYMRLGGLSFDEAHAAVLRTDPLASVGEAALIRLISINLPTPSAPRGRKLTRRQRRQK